MPKSATNTPTAPNEDGVDNDLELEDQDVDITDQEVADEGEASDDEGEGAEGSVPLDDLTPEIIEEYLSDLSYGELKKIEAIQKYGNHRANNAVKKVQQQSKKPKPGKGKPKAGDGDSGDVDATTLARLEALEAENASLKEAMESTFQQGLENLPAEALRQFPQLEDESLSLEVRSSLLKSVELQFQNKPVSKKFGKATNRPDDAAASKKDPEGGDKGAGDTEGDKSTTKFDPLEMLRKKQGREAEGFNPWDKS